MHDKNVIQSRLVSEKATLDRQASNNQRNTQYSVKASRKKVQTQRKCLESSQVSYKLMSAYHN